ncbi:MAG: DUF4292 domain-containing protein [Bacteroidales bacterium]|nr:DUF4292 domain-containing protein [Bacteroidales bacterium]
MIVKHKKYILFFLAPLLLMTSCRTSKHLETSQQPGADSTVSVGRHEPPKPEPRLDAVANSQCASLTANYNCTVDGVAVTGQIRMLRDSIIWISVNKFVEMGRIVATPTRVRGFVRIPGVYFDGGYEEIASRWGIDVDFATLQALLLGDLPEGCVSEGDVKNMGENIAVIFRQQGHPQRRIAVVKNAATSKIVTSEVADIGNRQIIHCEYTNRTGAANGSMPSAIGVHLTSPKFKVSTTLLMEKYSFGQPPGFPYTVPSRCKKL